MITINSKNVVAVQKKLLLGLITCVELKGGWNALSDIHSQRMVFIAFIFFLSLTNIVRIGKVEGTKKQPKFIAAYNKYGYKYVLTLVGMLLIIFLTTKETYYLYNMKFSA